MKRLVLFLAATFSFGVAMTSQGAQVAHHRNAIAGRYVILLDPSIVPPSLTQTAITSLAHAFRLNIQTVWLEGAVGFVCNDLPDKTVALLSKDPRISVIEDDFVIHDNQVSSGTQNTCLPACGPSDYLWNLDRIDQVDYHTQDGLYHMCPEGRSVYAYVLDRGVRADHEQFNLNEPFNRVVKSATFDTGDASGTDDTSNGCANYTGDWHGTAVASVLAGTWVGGAKTNVISLRVWTCGDFPASNYSWMISAINWIGSSNDDNRDKAGVVNWSGGWAPWAPDGEFVGIKAAITSLVRDRHKPIFISANNFAGDACQFSPNELAYTNTNKTDRWVFVLGGTSFGPSDYNDYRWQEWDNTTTPPTLKIGAENGSNGGSCVSMYAPAVSILAARNASTTSYDRASGTSFAAPLAAAVAARYMEKYNLNPTTTAQVAAIYDYLLNTAASTGTPLYNVNTAEYWMCATVPYTYYPTDPGSCPGSSGLRGGTTPIHFPATTNSSNAGILYSNLHIGDPNCP